MTKFTKEQLIERARTRLEHMQEAMRDHSGSPDACMDLRLAEMAYAAVTAEPVGEFYHEKRWGWYQISEGDKVPEDRHIPLYRLPLLEGLK